MPPTALAGRKIRQRILLTPARNAAYARSTDTNRPKNTTETPCRSNRYRAVFSFRSSSRTLGPYRRASR